MRIVIWIVAAALVASVVWRYRSALGLSPEPSAPAKPFVFDNGSVRDQRPASQPAGPPMAAAPGSLRKCLRAGDVSYTNLACPPGYKEAAVAGDRLTVVPGLPRPAVPVAAQKPSDAPSALHEALDLKRDDALRQRVMERAMQGAER